MSKTKSSENPEVSQLYPKQISTIGRVINCDMKTKENYIENFEYLTEVFFKVNEDSIVMLIDEIHSKEISYNKNLFHKIFNFLKRVNKSFKFFTEPIPTFLPGS